MIYEREAGILLPVFSLYGKDGIGGFGEPSHKFIEFLRGAGVKYWQILPLNPTGEGDSPYQSFSAFALNPYFLDLELLVSMNLLLKRELKEYRKKVKGREVQYHKIYTHLFPLLKKALEKLDRDDEKLQNFIKTEDYWLTDYSLFMAIKEDLDMKPLWQWPHELFIREEKAIKKKERELSDTIMFYKKLQYLLHISYKSLKDKSEREGLKIMGDMPIYVSRDSCDFWASRDLFQADERGMPERVAGCPPDVFCPQGQRWGNPLYNWKVHEDRGYSWWLKRLFRYEKLYHGIRLDHFRGLASFYTIPKEDEDATKGRWEKGPGIKFLNRIKEEFPDFLIIAENLGHLTDDVDVLLEESGFPGMAVIQFAFDGRKDNPYLPRNYRENLVAYTGTHDNETIKSFVEGLDKAYIDRIKEELSIHKRSRLPYGLVKEVLKSRAELSIIPLQDFLLLGNEGRINVPGSSFGNWKYRIKKKNLSRRNMRKIRNMLKEAHRLS